jgi:hypothetical protein
MKKNRIAITLLVVVTATILLFLFRPVLQHPNSYLFSTSGDAVKSYYNFAYYLKFDRGIRHDGINYPYGEHLQYINSHPLYVQILKFIDKSIFPIANYGVAILNLSMIISLLLTVPFLFLILRKFALPRWYAFIISLIILFLTPQFDRIHGHFEMVYAFFLPLYWYLLIRWKEGRRPVLWGILLVLAGLVGGFTSAYYAAFFTIFLLAVLIIDVVLHRKNLTGYWKTGLSLLVMAIIPVVIVKGLVSITDWVSDRPDNPWGFFIFHATPLSIFLPFNSPLKMLVGDYINMNFQWEGRSYVGFPATLLAVSVCLYLLYKLITWKKVDWRLFFPNKQLNIYLAAAFLVLLFSMAFPFKYGFAFLLELLPPVKQFRAVGRFAWIFYYVFTVYTAYYLYILSRQLKIKGLYFLSLFIFIFILTFWFIDAGTNIKRSMKGIFNRNDKLESFDEEYLSRFETARVNPDDFQAIFFLPFASTSGDKLMHERGLTAFTDAMKCSYHTGLPLIQSFSPRLSFTHALSSIQLLADSSIYKTRPDNMNDKPVLLVSARQQLNERELRLKSMARDFWEDDYITLSTLPVKAFNSGYTKWIEYVDIMRDSLTCKGNICTDTYPGFVIYDGFENVDSDNSFTGNGALYRKKGEAEIIQLEIDSYTLAGRSELSFWMYIDPRTDNMPEPVLYIRDENDQLLEKTKIENRKVHNVWNHWARISAEFEFEHGKKYQLVVKGKYITVDDLLIKSVHSNVLIKTADSELFNNYPL